MVSWLTDLLKSARDEARLQAGKPVTLDPKQPICNLDITITGWEGKYGEENRAEFLSKSNKLRKLGRFAGDYTLLRDGTFKLGSTKGLHRYSGEIDLNETFNLNVPDNFEMRPFYNYNLPHVHITGDSGYFHSGYMLGHISPESLTDKLNPLKFQENAPLSMPHYTLEGIYYMLDNSKMSTKINAIQKELLEKKGYEFNSIATKKETRVKLLELKYRQLISNQ